MKWCPWGEGRLSGVQWSAEVFFPRVMMMAVAGVGPIAGAMNGVTSDLEGGSDVGESSELK